MGFLTSPFMHLKQSAINLLKICVIIVFVQITLHYVNKNFTVFNYRVVVAAVVARLRTEQARARSSKLKQACSKATKQPVLPFYKVFKIMIYLIRNRRYITMLYETNKTQ